MSSYNIIIIELQEPPLEDELGAFEVTVKQGIPVDLKIAESRLFGDLKEKRDRKTTPFSGHLLGVMAPADGITIQAVPVQDQAGQ